MYNMLIILFLLSFFMSFMLSFLSFLLTSKTPDKEKVSTFECGFNPMNYPGQPFSMSFFVMGMLFLVFDMEMSLLFPWSSFSLSMSLYGQFVLVSFIIMLMMGLMYEFMMGGLEWE